ncbi:uncharacterized protein LOC114724483 [Neltuma alba]|uniref:uncharacterized protein LOC114724483 n=1 Tax=Neltuma alba TaxID=207710 RepID=UPI0010A46053|nr:uncharacterized protein LOC114724483 [Prosopis alba]
MRRVSTIKELHDGTDRWRIVAKVFRKWNVYQKSAPAELFCISMVLIDEEGHKIQASVMNNILHEQYRNSCIEGTTYFFANFVVSSNVTQYRATNHPFKINFTQQTFVRIEPNVNPSLSFSLMKIQDILKNTEHNHVDYLIDVIGFVKSLGHLEEYRKDNDIKHKLKMALVDQEDNEIECILFDECSTNAYTSYLENMDSPVVALFNLARVSFADDGSPQICSSFNATRVYFNPINNQVKEFIESAKDKSSPVLSYVSQPAPTQLSQPSVANILNKNKKVAISEIPHQNTVDPFIIKCTVMKLETRHGWMYDGCSKCAAKPKDQNGSLYCATCKKAPESVDPKLKVTYIVHDSSGKVSVTFWDKLAVQLFGKTAPELKVSLPEGDEFEFPEALDNIVGRKMILKLKLNEYNKKFPHSSISVIQYTNCEDLMDQFTQASSDVSTGSAGIAAEAVSETNDGEVTPQAEQTTGFHSSTPDHVDTDDNITLSKLSECLNPMPNKGKRKVIAKKAIMLDEPSSSSKNSSTVSTGEPVVKVIKQEKM